MKIELIIVILGMLIANAVGFYFGYLKREDKPPEMPELPKLSMKKYTVKKDKEVEPKSFYD